MISKTITAVACVSAFAMAAPAAQAKSPLPMSYAKHQAWETAQDYTETTPHDDLGYQSQKCRRINLRVVDCKTKIELRFVVEDGSTEYDVHSWTMRYRADRHEGAPIWYFPQDPYASTDPTDPKFGGIALHIS